jgi:hypothetical protein
MMGRLALPVVLAASVMLGGCIDEDRVVYVRSAPPPEAAEVVAVSPGPDHLYIRGHWEWDGTHYVWKHSRYLRRPNDRAVWVEGHWQSSEMGWFWQPGHWTDVAGRKVRAPRVVVAPAAPQAEEEEGSPGAQVEVPFATPQPSQAPRSRGASQVPPAPTYMPPPPPAAPPPPAGASPQRYVAPTPGAEY